MLYELIVFGSIWFWLLVALQVIVLSIAVFKEDNMYAGISVCVFVGVLQLFSDVDVLQQVIKNPWLALVVLGTYAILGVAWAICRWAIYVYKRVQLLNDLYRDFLKMHHLDEGATLTEAQRNRWLDRLKSHDHWDNENLTGPPSVRNHKATIIHWMAFWPFSFLAWMIGDLCRDAFGFIYNMAAGTLQRISNRIYGQLAIDRGAWAAPDPDKKSVTTEGPNTGT